MRIYNVIHAIIYKYIICSTLTKLIPLSMFAAN